MFAVADAVPTTLPSLLSEVVLLTVRLPQLVYGPIVRVVVNEPGADDAHRVPRTPATDSLAVAHCWCSVIVAFAKSNGALELFESYEQSPSMQPCAVTP